MDSIFAFARMESAIGVIMRVPGLFIIDYWWQHERKKSLPHSMEGGEIINCVLVNSVLLHGFLLLLLPLRYVRALYTHFVSGAMIISCHMVSNYYVELEVSKNGASDPFYFKRQAALLVHHGVFGGLISMLLKGPELPVFPIFSVYALPVIARCIHLPVYTYPAIHNFCAAVTILNASLYVTHQLPKLLDCAKLAYTDALTVTETYGVGTLFTLLWNKLFVPTHFALFWLISFFVKMVRNMYHVEKQPWGEEWYFVILTTVSYICASPVTLVATSVMVSYLSHLILCATRAFLQGPAAFFLHNPMHSGYTEALILIILSLQTGLTEIKMPGRMAVMTILLFIVLSSLLQSMLEIAEPVILSLSAFRKRTMWRHLRALSLCLALLIFPLYLTKVLSAVFPIDCWMMIVFSSCILTSFQVVDLLVVHGLFIYDSSRSEPWENLDDTVYYTRAVTKILEFFVAIFVVGMGLWESMSGKWNWMNASILLVHCYCNVWQRLQTGWKSFLLRLEAGKKAKALPSAKPEQLAQLDDVCSICFGSMKVACVTPCQHFFHRTCLQKWFYVQDKCPLCHSVISLTPENQDNPAGTDGVNADPVVQIPVHEHAE